MILRRTVHFVRQILNTKVQTSGRPALSSVTDPLHHIQIRHNLFVQHLRLERGIAETGIHQAADGIIQHGIQLLVGYIRNGQFGFSERRIRLRGHCAAALWTLRLHLHFQTYSFPENAACMDNSLEPASWQTQSAS